MSRPTRASVAAPTRERSAQAAARPPAPEAARKRGASELGQLPLIGFLAGVGVLVCAIAHALSRATLDPSPLIHWAGLLVIALPIFYRLCSPSPSSAERLTLVCLLGMALYAVKLARDSLVYTFPDEPVHAFNADQIARHHELFSSNTLQPVTAEYPGLEGATSALMTLTGMSSFGAGILIVGAARLVIVIGLFVLFRRVSGSARIAGIGSAIYAGNPNFLFWGAQFSYQSLALPLLVLVVVALAERDAAQRARWGWAVAAGLGTVAVVITHHLTSYLLVAAVLALMLARRIAGRRESLPALWPFAALAAGTAAIWLLVAAPSTAEYLWLPLRDAAISIGDVVMGEIPIRELFAPDSGARAAGLSSAPAIARVLSFLSVLTLLVALPFGLRQIWGRYRDQPFALLLCAAALGFFAALSLRFVSEAWETGNRASEFMFVGLAFVSAFVALLVISHLGERAGAPRWLGQAVVTAFLGLILVGGALSGWPWDAHLPKPVKATFGGETVDSESLGMARWAGEHLPDRRFAASQVNARFLLAPGGLRAHAGRNPDIEHIVEEHVLRSWQLPLLRQMGLRYVIADKRRRSHDVLRGYVFGLHPPAGPRDRLLPPSVVTKFEQLPAAARLFHSGNIAVIDLEAGE